MAPLYKRWAGGVEEVMEKSAYTMDQLLEHVRDAGIIYLTPEAADASDEDPSNQLLGSAIVIRRILPTWIRILLYKRPLACLQAGFLQQPGC
jgi:hypothetical protein